MSEKIEKKESNSSKVTCAPILWLHDPVVFPFSISPILLDDANNVKTLEFAMQKNRMITVFNTLPSQDELNGRLRDSSFEAFDYQSQARSIVGTLARVIKVVKFPDGNIQILLRGLRRINLESLSFVKDVPFANFTAMQEIDDTDDSAGLLNALNRMLNDLSHVQPGIPEELKVALFNTPKLNRAVDLLAENLNLDYIEKLEVLTSPSLEMRTGILVMSINRDIEVAKVGMKIQRSVHESMSQSQREFFLREQLSNIKQELGEECRNPDIQELEAKLEEKELPEIAENVVKKELSRLEIIPQAAPEYHIAYSYINWILDLPWSEESVDNLNTTVAAKILDSDHYGLEDVKERILEFLAVLQLNSSRKAPILCLVGPPGVGKTSLGQSIAKTMDRKFVRIALGGVHDEAEIRGHRRTYVGAMPGRIIQGMKRAETINPVFLLDEIDKMAHDMRGDPASAMLEVLDPEQNSTFNDHYLDIDYDLSKVFFLATANSLDTIPTPLLDRMEIIRLSGYTSFEKREIAKRFLVPRQLHAAGLNRKDIKIRLSAIDEVINFYTREAGVRQLERTIAQLCRKLARRVVEGKIDITEGPVSVDNRLTNELLGPHIFVHDEADADTEPGVATGMAWTSYGGTILPIEVLLTPGKGELKLTGSLGKVMSESAQTAFSYIHSRAEEWGIDKTVFETNNFHIHVPDGSTPKDGPSAGITLATALLSLLTNRPVKSNLAMTGEITLRGKVTAIGGVREKCVAALRAGIKEIIMPEENRKDANELPEEVSKKLKLNFVSKFDEVLNIALKKER